MIRQLSCLMCLFTLSFVTAEKYEIVTTWDNKTINHDPITITLERNDASSFKITFEGPLFNDPDPPMGPPNEPFYGLWDYEVAEIFFLNDDDQYVEIEVGPYGQYIVLLLNGYRKTIRHSLFIDVTTTRTEKTWQGTAIVPIDHLPPKVTKMNAYAIHGTDPDRVYESLYPVPTGSATGPDFHKLEAFQPFDVSIIVANEPDGMSSVWTDSINGRRSFTISTTWNGVPLPNEEHVHLSIYNHANNSLVLKIDAPFYNDTRPPVRKGPCANLSDYEVVHFFLMNEKKEYVEIQLGPYGHHFITFKPYCTEANDISRNPIFYGTTREESRWTGEAAIFFSFLPPVVTLSNAASTHGSGADRKYNSLYPVPPDSGVTEPDYGLTQYFRAIDLSVIHPDNENVTYSQVWTDVIETDVCKSADVAISPNRVALAVLFGFAFFLRSF